MVSRSYQKQVIIEVKASIYAGERPCLVLPCGGGKTHTMAMVIKELVSEHAARSMPFRVLCVAHRRELINQLSDKLTESGLHVGRIIAGEPTHLSRPIQVASIQTIKNREKPEAQLLIVDEFHHVASSTYRGLFEEYPNAILAGCTATPFRTDGQGLGDVANRLIVGIRTDELVSEGFLVNPTVFAPSKVIDLKGVETTGAGDFNQESLGFAVDRRELIGDIVATWKKHASGLRTICFAVNKEHSLHICEAFRAIGVRSEHLHDGTTREDRANAMRRLRDGHTQVICNVDLFGEGVDIPALECVIMARPTQSLGLFLQQAGRAMRPRYADGWALDTAAERLAAIAGGPKPICVILDHAGNHNRHGFVTDRIEYSLEGKARSKSTGATGPAVKQCPKCYALVSAGASVCRAAMPTLVGVVECGHVFTVAAKEIEQRAGELVQVNAETLFRIEKPTRPTLTPEEKAAREAKVAEQQARRSARESGEEKDYELRRLIRLQAAKGFKPKWADFQYKMKYGHWPTKAMKEAAIQRIEVENNSQQRAAS